MTIKYLSRLYLKNKNRGCVFDVYVSRRKKQMNIAFDRL